MVCLKSNFFFVYKRNYKNVLFVITVLKYFFMLANVLLGCFFYLVYI